MEYSQEIDDTRNLLNRLPPNYAGRGGLYDRLGAMLGERFGETGSIADIQEAVQSSREAVAATLPNHPTRAYYLNNHSNNLSDSFTATGNIQDMHEAVDSARESVRLTPEHDSSYSMYSSVLSSCLIDLYRQTNSLQNLSEAIQIGQRALESVPLGNPNRGAMLNNLGIALCLRFERLGNEADLDLSIEYGEQVVRQFGAFDPLILHNLGVRLSHKYTKSNNQLLLQRAMRNVQDALRNCSPNNPNRPMFCDTMSHILCQMSKLSSSQGHNYIERAIDMGRQAAQSTPAFTSSRATRLMNLSQALCTSFEQRGHVRDLEEALLIARVVFYARRTSQHEHGMRVANLSDVLFVHFKRFGMRKDLIDAVRIGKQALNTFPADDTHRTVWKRNMAVKLAELYMRDGTDQDIHESIKFIRYNLERLSQNDETKSENMADLGYALFCRYRRIGRRSDLDEAVQLLREALQSQTPQGYARASRLINLGAILAFTHENIEEAISIGEQALVWCPDSHYQFPTLQVNVGEWLCIRFAEEGDVSDINRAISLCRTALAATPLDSPDRAVRLEILSRCYLRRFEETRVSEDLSEATRLSHQAERTISTDHFGRPRILHTLAATLLTAARQSRQAVSSLEDAIKWERDAIDMLLPSSPERALYLSELSSMLREAFWREGRSELLEESINCAREAMSAATTNGSLKAAGIDALANRLHQKFENTGDIQSLQESVSLGRSALEITPENSRGRPTLLSNLALRIGSQSELLGDMRLLNQAIQDAKNACNHLTPRSFSPGNCLGILALLLHLRFTNLQSYNDIDEAILVGQRAVEEKTISNMEFTHAAQILGSCYLARYSRDKAINDLDLAESMFRRVLDGMTETQAHRPVTLAMLALVFGQRYIAQGLENGIEAAIRLTLEALEMETPYYLFHALTLCSLAGFYWERFRRLENICDLDRSVDTMKQAIAKLPSDHSLYSGLMRNLGTLLERRFTKTGNLQDQQDAISAFQAVIQSPNGSILHRVLGGRSAGLLCAQVGDWNRSCDNLTKAVKLMPRISPASLSREDQEYVLSGLTGLSSLAATASLQTGLGPAHALSLLELGRGIMSSLTLRLQSNNLELENNHPELWKEYEAAREKLTQPFSLQAVSEILGQSFLKTHIMLLKKGLADPITSGAAERSHQAVEDMERIEDQIRRIEGFERFQLPPNSEELMKLADLGPIVSFNVNEFGSDALVITKSEIRHVSLPKLLYNEVQLRAQQVVGQDRLSVGVHSNWNRRNKQMRKLLEWLWDAAVYDILGNLDLLSTSLENLPRIFWNTSGLMGVLPVHAAGYYRRESDLNALDHAISTYIPTILSLKSARQNPLVQLAETEQQVLTISMPETQGKTSLRVAKEIESIKNSFAPLRLTSLCVLESPTPSKAMEEIMKIALSWGKTKTGTQTASLFEN
ncbi:hypothetical protein Forpe1208_v008360 [Fusarium oxysporum f. sp. rapae]|uniref:CHAT domain-containing protein n=1 Tax=Fusarium oxysporum f. sp. rapae TaxID=485398 RepID=A0A8J5NRS8_FUSOX|nr:hypothetical protein Forpe1208_v008360 [Fusarium oxysporum f. sp. rapae]